MRNYIYIIVMVLVSFLLRVIPVFFIKKQIKNKYIRTFLYYIPYVTLAVMTFPAIMNVTSHPMIGAAAMIVGLMMAWFGAELLPVAIVCTAVTLAGELLIAFL